MLPNNTRLHQAFKSFRHAHYPYALTANDGMLYWTDLNTQGVHYINVTTGKGGIVYSGHKHLLGLVIVTAKQQSTGSVKLKAVVYNHHLF